jgi:hypothetical protein
MAIETRAPPAAELLDAWELGRTDASARSGVLLSVTCRYGSTGELAGLSVGARNRLLLQARAELFGSSCDVVAECGSCGAELEARLPVVDLVSAAAPADDTERTLRWAGYNVRYRLPTPRDLVGLPVTPADAASTLLGRCVLDAHIDGREVPWTELPAVLAQRLDAAIAEADPDAVLEVVLVCPECSDRQGFLLDPVAFLWAELDTWAGRMLHEVHQLATAYGWDEAAVLALSPTRRQAYLQLSSAVQGVA